MKKIVIIAAVLVLLVAGGAAAFVLTQSNSSDNSSKFTLVKENGSIFYKQKEEDTYKELLSDTTKLNNGSFVKTSDNSYARVFLPDNSLISIDVSSEIQINFENNKTDIQQLIGKTWNRVQTLTQGGEYKVETPNTIAAVRGTIFGVGVDDDDHSRVFSIEHTINVGKHEKDKTDILEDVDLTDNKLANITNNSQTDIKIDLGDIPADILNSFWYKHNKAIDEEWQKIKDKKDADLAKLLQEALEKRGDYTDLKLGLPPLQTESSKIQEALADVYKLTNITQDTCSQYTQDQIQTAIDQLKRYKDNVSNYDATLILLEKLKEVCKDGTMTYSEALELQDLVNAANGQ